MRARIPDTVLVPHNQLESSFGQTIAVLGDLTMQWTVLRRWESVRRGIVDDHVMVLQRVNYSPNFLTSSIAAQFYLLEGRKEDNKEGLERALLLPLFIFLSLARLSS